MSAVHDGHGPLRCHDGCPAYAEFMAEMHDQMRPAEPPVSTGTPESKAAPSRPCINCGQPLPHVGTGWKESGACRRDEGNATLADKATPGMADVLAEHAYVPSGLRGVSRCACGVQFHGMPHDHRAHVAAALSAAGFGDTAAARAEALTEAAKWAIGCEHVTALHWCGGCCDQWRAALEAEAARIARAARPDTGGAE